MHFEFRGGGNSENENGGVKEKKTINLKVTKGKKHAEKIAKEEVKLAKTVMREAKEAFDAFWGEKCGVVIRDALLNAIKINVSIQSKALIMEDFVQ